MSPEVYTTAQEAAAAADGRHVYQAAVQTLGAAYVVGLDADECIIPPLARTVERVGHAREEIRWLLASEVSWPAHRVHPRYRLSFSGVRETDDDGEPVGDRFIRGEVTALGRIRAYQRAPRNTWYEAPPGVDVVFYPADSED